MALVFKKIKEYIHKKKVIEKTPDQLEAEFSEIKTMIEKGEDKALIASKTESLLRDIDIIYDNVEKNIKELNGKDSWLGLSRAAINDDLANLKKGKDFLDELKVKIDAALKTAKIEIALKQNDNPNGPQK